MAISRTLSGGSTTWEVLEPKHYCPAPRPGAHQSDAATIRALSAEPYVAEIVARALGSLATGACTAEQFPELIGTEHNQMGLRVPAGVSAESGMRMLEELQSIMARFAELDLGEPQPPEGMGQLG